MSLSNLKKEELKSVCSELNIEFSSTAKVIELKSLIEDSEIYRQDIELVKI